MARAQKWPTVLRWVRRILCTQAGFLPVSVAIIAFEIVLTSLIVRRVAYTEIDFATYVAQAKLFVDGERNYARLDPVNGSGPCVYPAVHLYMYAPFTFMSKSDALWYGQRAFAVLYFVTLVLVLRLYAFARVPPFYLLFLVLSKRLHSIYVLRMFNDPIAMVFVYLCMYALCTKRWHLACTLYSVALGVKMNVLLYLPALCVILFRALGAVRTVACLVGIVGGLQAVLGAPFLVHNAPAYMAGAFDFSRAFLYKWTVNWRFLSASAFCASGTARVLLACHVAALCVFGLYRWTGIGKQGPAWIWARWRGDPVPMSAEGTYMHH
ncbi:dolichyl-P-Man:Man5GlcNAc2-PP-dolichol alpha-1,3-mannosyltransferase [Malassezia vespertilionis]|uniref:Dol-P-Man:Man(5)GlcNAc(2)-PP-Dol alpha-1,3-mannosyltransferase n=1 Tax=Malassezia vespertilionis TaxID=2020962 RepID=A0A2N1JEJ9_9BASI|nr:dolichyl-P-Man:Man5GlcNAc2-PP-dolichol alpha-1,3-mannosyltransferase [Malassezia vespertilionis]PKI84969.1 Alg3p [Malassezia vespertilionis]WFD06136.1 dolichyl-P-Man:Man5GlcNAc2-PP-dolichol alpha-1,3-mannosyltransferase [Malassezia vespertilionis]